ncbi:MAG TPA: DNA-3-methyladenine glycosylase I [Dehalococcoidia bacterium]|jgi:3-methyladenine DNA glycosylase Tag|nr:DNA-3-methyladenine glycosylase I [Dehalococcoidia bacterium]
MVTPEVSHHREHHAPEQIVPQRTGDYLEVMSKAIFQTGISWKVVENKWPGINQAFHGFDHRLVASLTEAELADLCANPKVIRNRRKIEAIIDNARQMLDLEEAHGSFKGYLRSHGSFDKTVADLRKRFKFLGEMGAFYFLYVVGEEVPSYEDWCASRGREPMTAAPKGP